MKNTCRVSIIMPCYNDSQYIGEAITSITNQTFEDFELLIVDDGSNDGSDEIIRSINDSRLKYIRLDKNYGNYYARNQGIIKASGKYLAMFDSDDISHETRLQIQYDYLERKSKVGAIGSSFNLIDAEGKVLANINKECSNSDFKIALLSDNYMLQSTIFMRRYLIEKYNIFYNTRYKFASDYDFVFNCSKYFPIYNLSDYCVSYRINPKGITSSKKKEQQEYAFEIRENIIKYYFGDHFVSEEINLLNLSFHRNRNEILDLSELEALFNRMFIYSQKNKRLNSTKLFNFLEEKLVQLYIQQSD